MKIEKTHNEIISFSKVEETDYLLTNNKGEEKELTIRTFYNDDSRSCPEQEETLYDGNYKEIEDWEDWIMNFMGCPEGSDNEPESDPDDILDELRNKYND